MRRRFYIEADEHEFSLCAEDAIRLYYPDRLTPEHPDFEIRMVELQLALIECHMRVMFPTDLRRAKNTVVELKEKMRKLTSGK